MSTASELRELADDELAERLDEGRQELFNLRFQVVTGQLDNPRRFAEVKREVARVLTVQRERSIAAARAAENA
ncbi:MAG: large subunit ribosomal protein L29 [Nitriliruptoraceae bacterium]|jgi:large subunit ribosomal protein L29